jgi:ribonucleoside-triphosphate reductase (thioredoxin)
MFRSIASEFVYTRTYSRWIEELGRREIWPETVERYIKFIQESLGEKIPAKVLRKIRQKVLNFEVMPSMRFLWAAGDPAKQDNVTIYNCSFSAVDTMDAFHEALYILMCGTGYGFSVENKYVSQLQDIPKSILPTDRIYVIHDSRKGWADSVKELVYSLCAGTDFTFDYNSVRPAGSRLKTMGGRSSGPGPLAQLHSFIRDIFYSARGRKLTSLECHDIMNEIAQIVVVGGVRRSSEISLSDLDDDAMRDSKSGNFPVRRYMANNSATYYSKPDIVTFMNEWTSLIASRSGERGIFNLQAARSMAPARRLAELIAGTNPCAEIQLRSKEFCNLSEIVARAEDDLETMLEKVETAVWMGIIQACFTDFPNLNPKWKENCDEERLLGVSITGQMDAPHLFSDTAFAAYKAKAVRVAKKASEIMGIPMPAAITCVKPSGTVSQLVDSSSGLHARFSPFYIRRYRISANDPLFKMVRDQGVPVSPENGQTKKDYIKALRLYDKAIEKGDSEASAMRDAKAICPFFDNLGWNSEKVNTWVVSFPAAAPKNAITIEDTSALDQLEWYKKVQKNWCEHNASITVYVKPDEWLSVGDWVYKNWNIVNGVSFLPVEDNVYEQAPYEKITEEEYNKLVAAFPTIDYSQLSKYEKEDNTDGAKSLACASGNCEI